ncbi:MAG: very short patch repair endonuclease [Planctomycetota bacterium]
MTDVYTKSKRSEIMARIKGNKTSPEKAVASMLRKLKVNFRRNVKFLPGQPDFVIPLTKTVIFVNGCFWHNHANCKRAKLPSTNRVFWKKKILGNKRRDNRINRLLRKMGWHVLRIWQCKLRQPERVLKRLKRFIANLC